MPKVSIIVPIYNAENCLARCIDSILAQTYSDFELILVDDGSNDASDLICDNFAQKDNRIIVIHKENGGTSNARNKGLEIATGEYITFVDSDDTISANYLEAFSFSADFEIAGLEIVNFKGIKDCPKESKILSSKEDICDWFSQDFDELYLTTICSKVFCREIIENNSLQFDTTLKRGEDTNFVYSYLSHCQNIKLIPSIYYQYYTDESLISHKYSLSANECITHIQAKVSVIKKLEKYFNVKFNNIKKVAHTSYLHLFYTHLKSISKGEKKSELITFRKNSSILQLQKTLNLKNYIYWRILPTFLIAND